MLETFCTLNQTPYLYLKKVCAWLSRALLYYTHLNVRFQTIIIFKLSTGHFIEDNSFLKDSVVKCYPTTFSQHL